MCGVMTFAYYVMFIHNMFIFKRKVYHAFYRHRTVSMTAVYQLTIKYDQDKFGAVFFEYVFNVIKRAVSFPLEDKHVVNEHHVIRNFNVPRDWFETNSQHQKRYSEGGKKNSWVSQSTGKSNILFRGSLLSWLFFVVRHC